MNYLAVILCTLALVLDAAPTAAQQSPCRDRIIKVCETDSANPLCTILRQDATETPESIFIFLSTLGKLSEPIRRDLICARLMGSKSVANLTTSITDSHSRNYFGFMTPGLTSYPRKSNRWFLALNNSNQYTALLAAHAKLASLNKGASREIEFDFLGNITFVHATYSEYDQALQSFEIHANYADLVNIKTPHANGDLGAQLVALNTMINNAYKDYMKVGLKDEAELAPRATRGIPILLDVVHRQGITTLVLQFPETPHHQVVRQPGKIEVRMSSGDRLVPPPVLPTVSDPLVQGVTITPEQVRIQLAPGAQTSHYELENPFRIVFDVHLQAP